MMINQVSGQPWSLMAIILAALFLSACGGPKTITIKPDSRVIINKKPVDQSKTPSSNKQPSRTWRDDGPVTISSDRMTYLDDQEETVFEGQVKVRQEGLTLSSPYLKVNVISGQALAMGGVRLVDQEQAAVLQAEEMLYARDLSSVSARKNVVLTSKDEQGYFMKLQSNQLDWEPKAGSGEARGNVTAYYKNTTATAEVMLFSDKNQTIIMKKGSEQITQRPEVRQDQDRIIGDLITLKINEQNYIVSGQAEAYIDTSQSKQQREVK